MRLIYPSSLARQSAPNIAELSQKLCAIVWTLYRPTGSINYLPGLIVSLYSAKKWHELYRDLRLVVMVTPDMPHADIDIIAKLADHIWLVPYITRPVRVGNVPSLALAGQWINSCFTKFNAMALPYRKIIMLDCDTLVLRSIAELFDCDSPAACYAQSAHQPYGTAPNYYTGDGRIFPMHGEKLPVKLITQSMADSYVPGGVLVLTPDPAEFAEMMAMLDTFIFGVETCLSKPDDQALALFYCKKNVEITNISPVYNTSLFRHAYQMNEQAVVMHFSGANKPWIKNGAAVYATKWHQYACACQIQHAINLKEYSTYQVSTAVRQIIRQHRVNKRYVDQDGNALVMRQGLAKADCPPTTRHNTEDGQCDADQASQDVRDMHDVVLYRTLSGASTPDTQGMPDSLAHAAQVIAMHAVFGYDPGKRYKVDEHCYMSDRPIYDKHYTRGRGQFNPWQNLELCTWDVLADHVV